MNYSFRHLARPSTIFTEVKKSKIWPQFFNGVTFELSAFQKAAMYLKSKINLLRIDDWPMYSPDLVHLDLCTREIHLEV